MVQFLQKNNNKKNKTKKQKQHRVRLNIIEFVHASNQNCNVQEIFVVQAKNKKLIVVYHKYSNQINKISL